MERFPKLCIAYENKVLMSMEFICFKEHRTRYENE